MNNGGDTIRVMYPEFTPEGAALFLRRTLHRQQIERIVQAARIVLLVFSAAVTGLLCWYAVSHLAAPPQALRALEDRVKIVAMMTPNAAGHDLNTADFEILRETAVFGQPPKAATEKPEPEATAAPVTELNLELIGTFITSPVDAQAIIEDRKTKVQEVFSLKEQVFGEATLSKINSNSVELVRNGRTEILTIDEGPSEGGTSDPNAEEIFVDEGELNEALDNLPLLLTQARAVPYFKEGKAVGLRLFAIRTGSLYDKIGLQNGDILKSINDKSLADISQAMKLFEQLREERSLVVELERNRQEKTYRYVIQ